MMGNKKTIKERGQGMDRMVLWSIRNLLRWQSLWSNWMGRKTKAISARSWIILLVFFTMASMGYNTWLVWKSISGPPAQKLSVTPIERPEKVTGTRDIRYGDKDPNRFSDTVRVKEKQ